MNSPDFSFWDFSSKLNSSISVAIGTTTALLTTVSLPVFTSLVETKDNLMIRITISINNDIDSTNNNCNSFFIHRADNTYQMLIMHMHPSLKVNNLNNIWNSIICIAKLHQTKTPGGINVRRTGSYLIMTPQSAGIKSNDKDRKKVNSTDIIIIILIIIIITIIPICS